MSSNRVAKRIEFEPRGGSLLALCDDRLYHYSLTQPNDATSAVFVASLDLGFVARDFGVDWVNRKLEAVDMNGNWHAWVCGKNWLMSAKKFSCSH